MIASLFAKSDDAMLLEISMGAIRLFSFAYLFRWFVMTTQGFLSAVEKPALATVMSVSVALLFPLLMLGALWMLDLDGIWLNFVGANILATILGIFLLSIVFREIKAKEKTDV